MRRNNLWGAFFVLILLGLMPKAYSACSVDNDCPVVEGLVAQCDGAGEEFSSCVYHEPNVIEVLAITDENCSFCSTKATEKFLDDNFLDIDLKVMDYRSKQAKKIIKEYEVETLPFFLIGNEIKKEKKFHKTKELFEEKNGAVIAKGNLSGLFLFLNREKKPQRIDLFLDLYNEKAKDVYQDLVKFSKENRINLVIYPIASEGSRGYPQEEAKAILAINEVYPNKVDKYISWRVDNIEGVSWVNGLVGLDMNYKKIKKVMDSKKIENLIEESNGLIKELRIARGNVILINNTRIFQVVEVDEQGLMDFFKK